MMQYLVESVFQSATTLAPLQLHPLIQLQSLQVTHAGNINTFYTIQPLYCSDTGLLPV